MDKVRIRIVCTRTVINFTTAKRFKILLVSFGFYKYYMNKLIHTYLNKLNNLNKLSENIPIKI